MIFRNTQNIDKAEFEKIWDTFAHVMDNEEESEKLLELRQTLVWEALEEIGSDLAKVIPIRDARFVNLIKLIGPSFEREILYGIQVGYMLRLVAEYVKSGKPIETRYCQIDKEIFIAQVLDYPSHYIHTPIEISLCEFNSQVVLKSFIDENLVVQTEQATPMKEEIFSASLYGFAAAVIEESYVA